VFWNVKVENVAKGKYPSNKCVVVFDLQSLKVNEGSNIVNGVRM